MGIRQLYMTREKAKAYIQIVITGLSILMFSGCAEVLIIANEGYTRTKTTEWKQCGDIEFRQFIGTNKAQVIQGISQTEFTLQQEGNKVTFTQDPNVWYQPQTIICELSAK